jgi:hypothetical protein
MSEGSQRDDRSAEDIIAQILAEETARISGEGTPLAGAGAAAGTPLAGGAQGAAAGTPLAGGARAAEGAATPRQDATTDGSAAATDGGAAAQGAAGGAQGASGATSFSPAGAQARQAGAWDLPDLEGADTTLVMGANALEDAGAAEAAGADVAGAAGAAGAAAGVDGLADAAGADGLDATSVAARPAEQADDLLPYGETTQEGIGVLHAPDDVRGRRSHLRGGARDAAGRGKGGRRGRIAVAAIVCGLGVVYVGGAIWYSSHFTPNTTLNGQDVSGMSKAALVSAVTQSNGSYSLHVTGDGLDLTVSGPDISLANDGEALATSALAQTNPWAWPVALATRTSLSVGQGTSYDADALSAIVSDAVSAYNEGAEQPTNASLAYDASAGSFSITPDSVGTALDEQAVLDAVATAVSQQSDELALGSEELLQPALTEQSDALKASLAKANQVVSASVALNVGGTAAYTIEPAQLAQWVGVDETGALVADESAISAWVSGTLAPAVDSVGTTRTYTRPDGKSVTVTCDTHGGAYASDCFGWKVDRDATATEIAQAIDGASGPLGAMDVSMSQSAASYNPGGQDWGSRYIDVDITEQHARMYDESGNLVWESDFVSGDTTKDRGTLEGVWVMNSNRGTDQTLKGADENGDGEPDYESQVSLWMPFISNLYAFHDATWRSTFGGTVYQGNGSHGCVNLPYSAASSLWDLCKVGDVVVVHY